MMIKLTGKFIVFDGPDGCGKSTQMKILADGLKKEGLPLVTLRDPGGTVAGDAIREILLHGRHGILDIRSELMLFMASRAQLMKEKIKPAASAGKTIFCDRYISASCAYQGAGGLAPKEILKIGSFAVEGNWPDLTIILDVSPETGFERISKHRGEDFDAMENRGLDFHAKVREIFLKLPEIYPGKVVIVNAEGTVEEVHNRILELLKNVDF